MHILILDDQDIRHQVFRRIYAEQSVTSVSRYSEFLNVLSTRVWDLIHLDHDLGDFVDNADTYVDGWGKTCEFNGQHAALRVCELSENLRPARVIVHSINSIGAAAMLQTLRRAGIPSEWEPFGEVVD